MKLRRPAHVFQLALQIFCFPAFASNCQIPYVPHSILGSLSGIEEANFRKSPICVEPILQYASAMIGTLERRIYWKHWGILAKYGMGSEEARAANRIVKAGSPSQAILDRLEAIWAGGIPLDADSSAARG